MMLYHLLKPTQLNSLHLSGIQELNFYKKKGRRKMQLAKHFKLEEFTKSMTATRKGIKNMPGAGEIKNL